MTVEAFLNRLAAALEAAQIPYMVTGSFASSAHGVVRGTHDIDLVITASAAQLRALVAQFPSDQFYADEVDARQIEDAAGIIATQGADLDRAYVEKWVRELELERQWELALEQAR